MNPDVLMGLAVVSGALMALERWGMPTMLGLAIKGDLKRESRWLAQYGQTVCTLVAALLVWQLDSRGWRAAFPVLVAVFGTGFVAIAIKRLLGRVRPGRENAGKFLGPTLKHANFRESFPSSHSACAAALSVILSIYYPQATITFWSLAVICAALRYFLDAHWPSDIAGGLALGYGIAHLTWVTLGTPAVS